MGPKLQLVLTMPLARKLALDLPPLLRWFTANIGIHHVHHLASRVPFYRLTEVLRAYPQLGTMNRFTMLQTFGTVRLALWDEDERRLVRFPKRVSARRLVPTG